MFERLPFPFPGDQFPEALGAVVQHTVLDGREPARQVIHAEDGRWIVGDGVNDPNEPGAVVATHIWHAIGWNSSITELVGLPVGHVAVRAGPGEAWRIEKHEWPEDDPAM